jgi:glucuronate isomerase
MKKFLDDNFLLDNATAEILYHEHAEKMPIIDYHNHLPPDQIASDKRFENITQAWLAGDHYKWRAMRANGIDERFITGNSTDYEKFEKWAETVPYTMRNPLYHWTHLELSNPFGIHDLLSNKTSKTIYETTSEQLRSKFSAKNLLRHFNVRVLCTTDDPIDDLQYHRQVRDEKFEIKVLPTFRPDKAMSIGTNDYHAYLDKLGEVSNQEVKTWTDFLHAIQKRHDYFAQLGCRLSDHGLETFYSERYSQPEIEQIFLKARSSNAVTGAEEIQFKSACLYEFAKMDAAKKWTQQFHVGAIRNNNSRLRKRVGVDAGVDSIGDLSLARPLSKFLDRLDEEEALTQTIIYNLNPSDNEVIATMAANFNDGSVPGKMQYGAAWWFLDQKDGMEKQLEVLSNMGLLSRFVGMLTDSRSFLSFSRHEYFRRILCNIIGRDVERGQLPNDPKWLGKIVEDICYHNAERYFGF